MSSDAREQVVTVDPSDNVLQALYQRARDHAAAPAFMVRGDAGFKNVSTAEVVTRVRELGAGLIGAGVGVGDRVAIFSHARVEWALIDYAIWQAGAVSVTIYETSSPDQVKYILENSGAMTAIVENDDLMDIVEDARADIPELKNVFSIEDGGFDKLRELGENVDGAELDARAATLRHESPATLVYTSGTTGRPKGCVLTHLNLIWTIRQVAHTEPELLSGDNRTLTFLPLAHILARVVQLAAISTGVPVAFGGGIRTLLPDLKDVKPTWLVVVPRVLEKVYDGAAQKAGSGAKRRIFDEAAEVARKVGAHRIAGTKVPWHLQLSHKLADKAVYGALRKVMGGQLTHVISGGAPLSGDLATFFSGVGIEVIEGYGLTETTGPASVHRAGQSKPGTVGPPLPGVDARISEDGEIQFAGNLVIDGYWENKEATDAAFDGKWFRTGDLGKFDEDGHLVITGRMKDLIVTAGGKNIAPVPLEIAIASHALVSHAVVVGDNRRFVAALVTLDLQSLGLWAVDNERNVSSPGLLVEELAADPELLEELQKAIDRANAKLSRAEGVRAFRVLPSDFTVASGELTPTMKVRRSTVIANYSEVVERIYRKPR